MDKVSQVLTFLTEFEISAQSHSKSNLQAHLIGTYNLLVDWQCNQDICLAGLCHSVYGTESYSMQSVPVSARDRLRGLIGQRAEKLTYLFGAHQKRSLWLNLVKGASPVFFVIDRFNQQNIELTRDEFSDLILLSLANKLEQRPRQPLSAQSRLQREMMASKRFLPDRAWQAFIQAYDLKQVSEI